MKPNPEAVILRNLILQMVESVPDAIISSKLNDEIFHANHQACVLFGYTKEEMNALDINQIIVGRPSGYDSIANDEYVNNPPTRKIMLLQKDLVGKRKDGTEFSCDVISNSVETTIGPIKVKIILDTTKKKEVEAKLQDSEFFNDVLFSSLDSHIAVVDADGNILACNKAWTEAAKGKRDFTLRRLKKEENMRKAMKEWSRRGNEYAREAYAGIKKVFNNEVESFEMRYPYHVTLDDVWYQMRVTKFPGGLPRVVMAHTDISEIVNANKQVAESKMRYKHILDTTKEIILHIDFEGKIIFANKAFSDNFQYSEEDMKNLKIFDIMTEDTSMVSAVRVDRKAKRRRKDSSSDRYFICKEWRLNSC